MLDTLNYRTIMQSMSTQDHLTIWQWILGRHVSIGQTFCNPLRHDKNPGCFLREYNGILLLTDYSHPQYSKYTCIHAVKELMNCTLHQAAINIYAALYFNKPLYFGFNSVVGNIQKGRKPSTKIYFNSYTYQNKPVFTKIGYSYWQRRFVSLEQLKNSSRGGKVYDVCNFYFDGNLNNKIQHPCFGYTFNSTNIKLYQPYSTKQKWVGSVGKNDYWLTKRNSKQLLISKAQKDHLCAENIFLDFDIFSGMNETTFPSNFGEMISNYKVVVSLLDNDKTGINASKQLQKEYDIIPKIINPESGFKDLDEYLITLDKLPLLKNCPIIDL